MSSFALVTGAAGRIGKAFAQTLAEMGYHIFLHYNTSREKAEQTRKLIEETGQRCILKQADFRKEKEVRRLMADCCEEGALEILINNASKFVKSDIKTKGTGLLDEMFETNFAMIDLDLD